MTNAKQTRRAFLAALAAGVASLAMEAGAAFGGSSGLPAGGARRVRTKHPDPRPGIDASRVLPADRVPADVRELFDKIREIPAVVDGIGCQCGCAELPDMYSLLSCYEGEGMAQHCLVCQGVGELAYRMHGEGRTLEEIRAAVDRRVW